MWGNLEDHDVTCLCANVGLPKRCIVEEMPADGGAARFQLQAFTSGAVGEALAWVAPVLGVAGARVRRWSGEFEFTRIEVEEGEGARAVRRAFAAAAAGRPGGLLLVFEAVGEEGEIGERLAYLSRALAAVG